MILKDVNGQGDDESEAKAGGDSKFALGPAQAQDTAQPGHRQQNRNHQNPDDLPQMQIDQPQNRVVRGEGCLLGQQPERQAGHHKQQEDEKPPWRGGVIVAQNLAAQLDPNREPDQRIQGHHHREK